MIVIFTFLSVRSWSALRCKLLLSVLLLLLLLLLLLQPSSGVIIAEKMN